MVAQILTLISVLCCRLGNHAFPKPIGVVVSYRLGNHAFRKPIRVVVSYRLGNHAFRKPIRVVVSCRLGNHAFRKPITVVLSFEEPFNKLGQIQSQFDDMETNFYFGFKGHLFFQRASGGVLLKSRPAAHCTAPSPVVPLPGARPAAHGPLICRFFYPAVSQDVCRVSCIANM